MKSIKHNYGERNSLKMRTLMNEVGVKGIGVYWYLIEEIYEGQKLEVNEDFYNLFSSIFKLEKQDFKNVIGLILKHEILIIVNNAITSKEIAEIKEKRRNSGLKGMQKRWGEERVTLKDNGVYNFTEPVLIEGSEKIITFSSKEENKRFKESNFIKQYSEKPEEPKTDHLEELIKKAVASSQKKVKIPEVKTEEKTKPKRKKVIKGNPEEVVVTTNDFEKLEQMEIKTPLKDWEFLPLFNQLKLEINPNARGNVVLTATDKSNLKKLIGFGYGKEEFTKVINMALSTKYVQENGLDVPNHVLRNDNFERYLNKSDKKTNTFSVNETETPIYK